MTGHPGRVVLLGPQPDLADVGAEVDRLRHGSRVALVTAGWQEWEDDDLRLREAVGGSVINLQLYGRAETVWAHDPDLAEAHRELGRRVRLLRRGYNTRLRRLMEAWIELDALAGESAVLGPERAAALDDVRRLDTHHLDRIRRLRQEFDVRLRPGDREIVARERHALAGLLDGVGVVVVAGGHVPLLLNRLRLFDVPGLLGERSVVAWSGGAMAMAPRVVLFHDTPPWGPGHAEVGEVGLGLVPGVVPLPDGGRRLRVDDPNRVDRMARRFAPDVCLLLDPGSRAEWGAGAWVESRGGRLTDRGVVEPWRIPA